LQRHLTGREQPVTIAAQARLSQSLLQQLLYAMRPSSSSIPRRPQI